MRIDGGCHCGEITYEAEIDPEQVSICHCTDCQTLGGGAFRVGAVALDGTLKFLGGRPKTYVKTAESGTPREQAFCAACGSQIYSSSAGDAEPKAYRLRVGSIRQRDRLTPKVQIWRRSAQSWVDGIGSIRQVDTQ